MRTEKIANRCPKCQAPLPADAPQGLCAKCLLAAAATPTEAGQPPGERSAPPPLEAVTTAFPQLEIVELIGHGGMGVVYKARQPKLDRFVALKILPQSLAADAAFAERFNREARVLARLNHPNIVTVHDFGQSGGFFFLLMEFVDGVNLRQAMQAGRFTPQQAMMLVPKICEALQFAHDEGILHRDIKPENILLDTRGRVKIADFGIAKLVGEAREKLTLTASGMAVGTPHYMAPEQLEHPQDVDQRADIYSLGVVFYEMLTGELPIGRFAAPSTKSAVDPRVDDVVFHALEKEREKRFRTATEVRTSVEAITSNPAATSPEAAPLRPSSGAAITERRIPCYISTPEHLSTLTGQVVYIYTGKGELRLDAENLTFVSNLQSTVIPLRDIRELRIGHYPRLAKPLRLDYLAVTFEQAGQRQTLLFTPAIRSGISFPWEVNPRVAECFRAVHEAVITRTGKAPGGPSPAELPGSHRADGLWQAILLGLLSLVVVEAVALTVGLLRRPGTQETSSGVGGWTIFWVMCGVFLVAFIVRSVRIGQANRLGRGSSPSEPSVSHPAGLGPLGTMPPPANPKASPGSQIAGASAPTVPEARATCYFNTPARMRDCFPSAAARVFTCRGELALEGESLTFTNTWRTSITIPLKDIEDLSVGQFQMWTTPWVMKYARISFLSITFRQNGQLQTVHLTPVEPGAASAAQINDCVGRWFERLRQAASQCTGKTPPASDTASVSVSAEPAWNRAALPLVLGCLLMGIGTWVLQAFRVQGPIWLAAFTIVGVLVTLLLWFSFSFLRANSALGRGQLDAVTSDDPPAPEPASANVGGGVHHRQAARWAKTTFLTIALFALAVVLLLMWLSYKNRYIPASDEKTAGLSRAGAAAPVPGSEGHIVLYTMPLLHTNTPGVLHWHFKCLLPAQHLTRVVFIRWTNGVPEVHNDLSGCFEVGDAPIDTDFEVWGQRPAEADSTRPTNAVEWAVSLFGPGARGSYFQGEPAYLPLQTPPHMIIHSGHQGILPLVVYTVSDGQSPPARSGIELRILLEPMKHAPVRTDPFQIEGKGYVAGPGPGWTTDQALQAIKEWPVDE